MGGHDTLEEEEEKLNGSIRALHIKSSVAMVGVFFLWIVTVAMVVSMYNMRNELDRQTAVTTKIKQPLTVNVYPEVVQKYDGLPGFQGKRK